MTKEEKKSSIRKKIIDASDVYSKNLAGKVFLYIYGNEFFEVSFPVNRFLHLTGVNTSLNAKEFYRRARKSELTNKQFFFDSRHTYHNSKKKLPCLQRLPELTNKQVCILRDTNTASITYKLSVTNLEFTLGLIESDKPNVFLPMTLRVNDSSVERSGGGEVVDFIFSKDASEAKFGVMLVKDELKAIPESIIHLLS